MMSLNSRQGGSPLIWYSQSTQTQPSGAAGNRHRAPRPRPPLPDTCGATGIRSVTKPIEDLRPPSLLGQFGAGLSLETGRSGAYATWDGSLTGEIHGGEAFGPSRASGRTAHCSFTESTCPPGHRARAGAAAGAPMASACFETIAICEADAMIREARSPLPEDKPALGRFSLGRRPVPVEQIADAGTALLPAADPALWGQCPRPQSR